MKIWRLIGAALLCGLGSWTASSQNPQTVAADGRWAALKGADHCEAASLALLPASRSRTQGRASLSFDNHARHGQFAVALSRPPRPGSSVMLMIGETPFLLVARGAIAWSRGPAQEKAIIAAIRHESGMRVQARSASGSRFTDRYLLDGAPTAIDAAAACAATHLVNP